MVTGAVLNLPRVIGACSGELHGATTNVESLKCSSGMSFERWNSATLYSSLSSAYSR